MGSRGSKALTLEAVCDVALYVLKKLVSTHRARAQRATRISTGIREDHRSSRNCRSAVINFPHAPGHSGFLQRERRAWRFPFPINLSADQFGARYPHAATGLCTYGAYNERMPDNAMSQKMYLKLVIGIAERVHDAQNVEWVAYWSPVRKRRSTTRYGRFAESSM